MAALLMSGCDAERGRGAPATTRRVEPPRAVPSAAAHVADDAHGTDARPETPVRIATRRAADPNALAPRAPITLPPTPGTASSSLELPPGVNEEFDEDVLLDIDEALGAIDENAFAMLFKKELVLVDDQLVRKEKFAHPDNCRRWRGLRNRGYAPKSAVAKQVDAGALVRCGSLEFLARAQPSRVTHVRDALVGAGPGALPAIAASATSVLAQQARERAVARGSTLAEFLPNSHTITSELPGRLSIAEPASESSIILNREAWGDINSDGIEDLVLSVLNTSNDNSVFEMRLLHVTRLSPSAPLTVLAVIE